MAHYEKDFDAWTRQKREIHKSKEVLYFHKREVWWCSLGLNVGYEQDGKNSDYTRPVVILQRYGTNACLIIPLTSKEKRGRYYFDLGIVQDRSASAVLSQIRFIDRNRLVRKMGMIDKKIFEELKDKVVEINFGGK